jgi:hypothetical protein
MIETLSDKFIVENACWVWTAWLKQNRYPTIKRNGKEIRVRQLVMADKQPRPSAQTAVRDTCGNQKCVNPKHLCWEKPLFDRYEVAGDCWVWSGKKNWCGYGVAMRNGKEIRVHRLVLSAKTPIPFAGAVARHTCDNPSCIRPDHLLWGTHADNAADCVSRGRNYKFTPKLGVENRRARFSKEQIIEIWRLSCEQGLSQAAIGKRFGVRQTAILSILKKYTWAHVTDLLPGAPIPAQGGWKQKGSNHHQTKLDETRVKQILVMLAEKRSRKDIARKFGVGRQVIQNIASGKTWKHVVR